MRDYYAILGLPRTATPAEIDAAFRTLARKYHPDLQPEQEDATAQFKLASEAHEVLSDAERRREYDRTHRPRRRVPVSPDPPPIWSRKSPTGQSPAGPTKAARFVRGPLDVEAELRLMPEEAGRGGLLQVRVSIAIACSSCRGQGGRACKVCQGQGTVTRLVPLQLPPGLRDGHVLCLRGYGRAATQDGSRGDLYLVIRVRPCW